MAEDEADLYDRLRSSHVDAAAIAVPTLDDAWIGAGTRRGPAMRSCSRPAASHDQFAISARAGSGLRNS